jgi:hypothetical protein
LSGCVFKPREVFSKQNISVEKIYELPSRKDITSGYMMIFPDRNVFIEYFAERLKNN